MSKLPTPWQDRSSPTPSIYEYRRILAETGKMPPSREPQRKGKNEGPVRTPSTRVNVLHIMADELRADTFGFVGHPSIETPNLDRLARQGAFCSRSYCSSPVCAPSRATFMTGHYVAKHGVVENPYPMNSSEDVFTTALSENGYRTAVIGKVHCGRGAKNMWEYSQGVSDAFGATKPSATPFIPAVYPELKFISHDDTCDNSDWVLYGTYPGPVETTKSFHIANEAMKWLYFNDDPRPFYLNVSFDDPHPPLVPPEPYASMYTADDVPAELLDQFEESMANKPACVREFWQYAGYPDISPEDHRKHAAKYMGVVSHLDAQIGRIVDYLDQTEFKDNTIVVVNSDHGHMIGEHGLVHKGPFLYEGTNRIPTIVRWPGKIAPGTRVDGMIDGVDFVPTVFDMLGISAPDDLDGVSFLPLLTGAEQSVRSHVFMHTDDQGCCMIGQRYKLTRWMSDDMGELYDLAADPLEKNNLWNDPEVEHVQREMRPVLEQWWSTHGPFARER